mmetsp:Transcript_5906/g.17450  ORF Transcript_5906/g.17450 Transcript_5906/m.17450 type:complete len:255 (-) Transcript_5906:95-859(-)
MRRLTTWFPVPRPSTVSADTFREKVAETTLCPESREKSCRCRSVSLMRRSLAPTHSKFPRSRATDDGAGRPAPRLTPTPGASGSSTATAPTWPTSSENHRGSQPPPLRGPAVRARRRQRRQPPWGSLVRVSASRSQRQPSTVSRLGASSHVASNLRVVTGTRAGEASSTTMAVQGSDEKRASPRLAGLRRAPAGQHPQPPSRQAYCTAPPEHLSLSEARRAQASGESASPRGTAPPHFVSSATTSAQKVASSGW